VIEDQLDSNRPIQGVKVVSNEASLPSPRAAAPRRTIGARRDPLSGWRELLGSRFNLHKRIKSDLI
jgi:hypothetical protein